MTRQALSYMKAVESGVERAEADATHHARDQRRQSTITTGTASATRSHQDFASPYNQ
jgi:hypothetical protein